MPPMNHVMPSHAAPAASAVVAEKSSRFDSFARTILLALFAILPFFFFPVAWMTSLQSKIIVAAVLLMVAAVCWLVARVQEGGGSIPRNVILAATALLPIVYALSAAVNGFMSVSLVGTGVEADTVAIVCLEFAALALSAMLLGGSQGRVISALRALFAGLLVLEIIHILHVAFPSLSLGGVLSGKTGNAMGTWHEFTMLIGLGLIASLALTRSAVAEGVWKWVVNAVGIIALPILIISNFSDVWIAVGIAALVLTLVRWHQSRSAFSAAYLKGEWAPIAAVVLAAIFAIFGPTIVGHFPDRFSVVQVEVRPSWSGTFQIGTQSLSGVKPFIFGVGPNTFTRQWGLYKPLAVNTTPFWNADFNVGVAPIPTSFISLGILGALAWLFFVVSVLWSAISLWLRRTDAALSAPVLALSIASVYLVAFHLSSVPGTSLGLLMFLVIGLYVASIAQLHGVRTFQLTGMGSRNIAKLGFAALVVVLAIVAGVGDLRAVVADALINKAVVAYNQSQDLQESTNLISESLAIQPNNDRAHRSAVELGLLKLQQLINAKDPNQDAAKAQLQATLEDTIKHGLTAVQIDSRDYQNWLQLASLYSQLAGAQIQGAYDNARAAYVRAQQENPTSPLPLLNLGQLDALEGNYPAALENLGKAVQLKPDLASAYYLASQIYVAQKDAQNALLAGAQAARYAPNDPLAWYNAGAIAYAAGDYRDAGIAMQQALALQPQYANAMYILGLSLYQLNDPQDALTVFNALNQLDPNQPVVLQIISNLQAGKRLDQQPQTAAPQQTTKTPAATTKK